MGCGEGMRRLVTFAVSSSSLRKSAWLRAYFTRGRT